MVASEIIIEALQKTPLSDAHRSQWEGTEMPFAENKNYKKIMGQRVFTSLFTKSLCNLAPESTLAYIRCVCFVQK